MKHKIITLLSLVIIIYAASFHSTSAAYTSDLLVLSLNLDENGGVTAADSSEHENDGTVSGSPAWSGGSITFDGIDDKIIVPNDATLNSASHSYEVWYTMPNSAAWSAMASTAPRLIDKVPNTNIGATNIFINKTTRKVTVFFASSTWSGVTVGTSSGNSLIGATTLDYSTDYQITFVYNNTTRLGQIYVNGVLDSQGTTSGNYVPNTTDLAIGGRPGDNARSIVGDIHRVSVYGKALSFAEVTDNYAEGKDYNYVDAPDPASVSAAQSTVEASVNTIEGNGTSEVTITVTTRNYLGDLLTGKSVSLTSSRGVTDTISPASVNTNGSGVATFTVTSSTAGSPVFTAVADGTTIAETQTIIVTDEYVTATDITYTSTLDNLSLKMDVAYDSSKDDAPVVIYLHGYSGPFSGTDIIDRLARKGVFAIKTYKRSYNGSQGDQDDSGREIHDFYDAIEYVKENYSEYINPESIHVMGSSGGGGNTYGLITKFPDYFTSASVFFGMSDYCYDPTFSWWYNGGAGFQAGMQNHIGGTPNEVPDECYSRAHHLGAKNNPDTHIQLFYDTAETIAPLSHGTQYVTQNTNAGFSNVVNRTSSGSSTTTELSDDFSTNLSDYSFNGDGSTKFIWDADEHIEWSGDTSSIYSSIYKKFTSLRNYSKTDRIEASFDFSIDATENNGTILFGFRDSDDTSLRNAASVIIIGNTLYARIDYNGVFSTGSNVNREISQFTTTLTTGTTYGLTLSINNSVLNATLRDSNGNVLETESLAFNASKGFDGVDSFGIYNYNSGANIGNASGKFDDLTIDAYARWTHGYPQEGAGSAEGNITAENYILPDIVSGTWNQPTLNTTGTMFIPGYIKTKKFQVFLGNGNDEAGNLSYDISGTATSVATAKTFTVEGLTGTSTIDMEVYDLAPNTEYTVKDTDITNGGDTLSQVSTDAEGMLTFSGTLGSTHQYDIYSEVIDVTDPVISAISASPLQTEATITWTTDEAADSQVEYGLSDSYTDTTVLDASLVTSHSVELSGLEAGTTYHYRVISADASGNTSMSADQTFTTDEEDAPSTPPSSSPSRSTSSRRRVTTPFPSFTTSPEGETTLGEGAPCAAPLMVTQNLKQGARDGVGGITQVALLQSHINRILANYYNQAAGPVDGIFGPLTQQGVERLQMALRDHLSLDLGPAGVDGIVGLFTKTAINMSC